MAGRHSTRATRALAKLSETDPAFASLALWIDHRDSDTQHGVAWSDAATIFYGPRFEALSLAEQMGLAAHHILHVAFRHTARSDAMRIRFGPAHDPALYNLAADAILNEAVFRAGLILPRPAVLLTELLTESFGQDASPDTALSDWDADALYIKLLTEGGQSGSTAADGARAFARKMAFDEDLKPAPGQSDAEDSTGEWQQRLARAMEAGRAAGRGIGLFGHRMADLPEPRTPWEVILRSLVTKAVTTLPRRSWSRPTGRWLAQDAAGHIGPFEPGTLRNARAPRIAVALDSSGSVADDLLRLFASQIDGIARRTGAEVHLFIFDDGIRDRRTLRAGDTGALTRNLATSRGGGTDYRDVFREAEALDPATLVVLTDLEAPMPRKPRMPVIWAVPDDPATRPPFGMVLNLAR